MTRLTVVTRATFPAELRGAWNGGEVDFCRMTGACWAGRTGRALIAWESDRWVVQHNPHLAAALAYLRA